MSRMLLPAIYVARCPQRRLLRFSYIKRVKPHFPATPIVGTRSPRGGQTRWFIFYKPLVVA